MNLFNATTVLFDQFSTITSSSSPSLESLASLPSTSSSSSSSSSPHSTSTDQPFNINGDEDGNDVRETNLWKEIYLKNNFSPGIDWKIPQYYSLPYQIIGTIFQGIILLLSSHCTVCVTLLYTRVLALV
ncbi:hypothetical protein QR98_0013670 [Sarcoptes scabiei]|uniref:Uncharacterized protein n=1 Tax=Sarcoptes scabiei TaxID=52283 RepID=A0A131ZWB0_SARSC|nr:hypothetical protein QR98_0013670 [Sarcoptes scabiei]